MPNLFLMSVLVNLFCYRVPHISLSILIYILWFCYIFHWCRLSTPPWTIQCLTYTQVNCPFHIQTSSFRTQTLFYFYKFIPVLDIIWTGVFYSVEYCLHFVHCKLTVILVFIGFHRPLWENYEHYCNTMIIFFQWDTGKIIKPIQQVIDSTVCLWYDYFAYEIAVIMQQCSEDSLMWCTTWSLD